jgi:hypothetical protein
VIDGREAAARAQDGCLALPPLGAAIAGGWFGQKPVMERSKVRWLALPRTISHRASGSTQALIAYENSPASAVLMATGAIVHTLGHGAGTNRADGVRRTALCL